MISQIRGEDARRFKVIPVGLGESGLIVAVSDPLDIDTIDSLSFLLQREIELVCSSPEKIREALIKYYGTADEASDILQAQLGGEDVDLGLEITESGEPAETGDEADAPIIRMVSMLLVEAHRLGASDIHLEPLEKKFRVRFRIDGVLQEMQAPPKRLQTAIVSRLKIMTGSMSIAEKRLPQDGRIQVKIARKPLDLRVSTIPTNHGESVVMRLLDKSSLMLGLPELGFLSDDQETFERLLRLPDGILLVTGPTGSGKTSTLYACLNYMNKPDRKIITVEEPVEYQMNGINQVQVNTEIGMTFPAALRSILRQAPNIIMIGEIRDLETASIATNASLTGHLVFSTLHTNDAPSAVARLVDLGMQPFLVASSVRAIMAQRLVRRLCAHCKQPGELSETEMRALRIESHAATRRAGHAAGRLRTLPQTGYRGRMGIFEIFVIDDEVRHMINKRNIDPAPPAKSARARHAHPARRRRAQSPRRPDLRRGSHLHHLGRRELMRSMARRRPPVWGAQAPRALFESPRLQTHEDVPARPAPRTPRECRARRTTQSGGTPALPGRLQSRHASLDFRATSDE